MAYFISSLKSSPTKTKDDIPGWETRLIFSQTIPTTLDLTSTNYFDAVSAFPITRGTLGAFPRGYWSQGRILRLKASFNYSCGGSSARLNVITSLSDGTNEAGARSDNGQVHDFAQGVVVENVPVHLEINYFKGGDDSSFGISGFYQYEWGSYEYGGVNRKVVHVPINNVYDFTLDFSQPTQLGLTINNQPIEIFLLTIEELG